jgi:hydroxymethylglutaryl-CoA reductase (NADPH)
MQSSSSKSIQIASSTNQSAAKQSNPSAHSTNNSSRSSSAPSSASTTSSSLSNTSSSDKSKQAAAATVSPQPTAAPPKKLGSSVPANVAELSDEQVVELVLSGKMQGYNLEKDLGDTLRAVRVRRMVVAKQTGRPVLGDLPFEHYDYNVVLGACCENVVGYVPLPCGLAGPILVDGQEVFVPMATTEGCLVASTHRGCKAINAGGGATTVLLDDGMTRGPVMKVPNLQYAADLKAWVEDPAHYAALEEAFNSSSRFARLRSIKVAVAARRVFLRFRARTGDAMGMNMITKGVSQAMEVLQTAFPDAELLAVSGNYCTDKKPAAINWIDGRGKSVVSEAVIPASTVEGVLKTTAAALVEVNEAKNMIGSAMAGSIGGFNAHASNILTAMYLACGQDPAQNVEASQCMTYMAVHGPEGRDLYISCTMPCIEVGTVGGGTILPGQSACLDLMGVKGANREVPGSNASRLARSICAGVMAGELSLMSALAAGHLLRSHMRLNRSSKDLSTLPGAGPH